MVDFSKLFQPGSASDLSEAIRAREKTFAAAHQRMENAQDRAMKAQLETYAEMAAAARQMRGIRAGQQEAEMERQLRLQMAGPRLDLTREQTVAARRQNMKTQLLGEYRKNLLKVPHAVAGGQAGIEQRAVAMTATTPEDVALLAEARRDERRAELTERAAELQVKKLEQQLGGMALDVETFTSTTMNNLGGEEGVSQLGMEPERARAIIRSYHAGQTGAGKVPLPHEAQSQVVEMATGEAQAQSAQIITQQRIENFDEQRAQKRGERDAAFRLVTAALVSEPKLLEFRTVLENPSVEGVMNFFNTLSAQAEIQANASISKQLGAGEPEASEEEVDKIVAEGIGPVILRALKEADLEVSIGPDGKIQSITPKLGRELKAAGAEAVAGGMAGLVPPVLGYKLYRGTDITRQKVALTTLASYLNELGVDLRGRFEAPE